MKKLLSAVFSTAALTTLAVGMTAMPAVAVPPPQPPPLNVLLPAGQGCPDFALRVKESGGTYQAKEVKNRDGSITTVVTRTGVTVTYTRYKSLARRDGIRYVFVKAIPVPTRRSVVRDTPPAKDSSTVYRVAEGDNGLILFPNDKPAGPSATQYYGRIEYTFVPATGFTVLKKVQAAARDMCAELRR
jgi:hypothetical protein